MTTPTRVSSAQLKRAFDHTRKAIRRSDEAILSAGQVEWLSTIVAQSARPNPARKSARQIKSAAYEARRRANVFPAPAVLS